VFVYCDSSAGTRNRAITGNCESEGIPAKTDNELGGGVYAGYQTMAATELYLLVITMDTKYS
jgi:hypothetical protein